MIDFDSNNQLHRAAIHEAGHVICHFLTDRLNEIEYVEIYTGDRIGCGLCEIKDEAAELSLYDNPSYKYNTKEGQKFWNNSFCIQVAGVCAEKVIFSDSEIDRIIVNADMDVFRRNVIPLRYCGLIAEDEDVEVALNGLSNVAIHLVGKMFSKPQNKELIEAVAEALLLKKDIDGVKRLDESEVPNLLKV